MPKDTLNRWKRKQLRIIIFMILYFIVLWNVQRAITCINHSKYEHKYLKKKKSQNYSEDIMLCITAFMPRTAV